MLKLQEIECWLICYIAELLDIEQEKIDRTIPFERYGLDSSAIIGMAGDLGDWLKKDLDPTVMFDYPTIEALSKYLAEEMK